jgi:predicted metal-binding membrane protein
MKPTQNTVVHGLLGAAVLLAILLLYLVLAHPGQPVLPPSRWILFGGLALALALAAFLPSLVRRWRGLPPPQPLSPADISLVIMVTLAGCALAFFGVFFEMWWLMAFAIMLPPLFFIWRNAPKQQHDRGNAGRDLQGERRL